MQPTPADRLNWHQQARFGLFIHWGAYSAAGVEASWPIMTPDLAEIMFRNPTRISQAEYESLPARFNPVHFDAREWVRLARQAGMRYIVFTAKHHDGFCMFDAPGTDYKITNTPFGRDVCRELADACAAEGMRLGFYYSPPDIHHPGYRDTRKPVSANWLGEPKRPQWTQYLDYMESHLRKLLSDYGEISVLWFDALVNHRKYDPPRFHRLIHELSPRTLINDRLGAGYDFITPEQFIPRRGVPVRTGKPPAAEQGGEGLFRAVPALIKLPFLGPWLRAQLGRYADGELELTQVPCAPFPAPEEFQPWETCMTMGQSWGYNPAETRWKDAAQLVRNLVDVASAGGNYLLNVGPRGDGAFPPEAVERLAFIGRWLENNGPAVYATTYAPPLPGFSGRVSRRGGTLYLHLSECPSSRLVEIGAISLLVDSVYLLPGTPLVFEHGLDTLRIQLPDPIPESPILVLALVQK